MTNSNFITIWTLMSKYRFIPDSDSIQDDLTCLICEQLMIDSFQSGCGCQYCRKCIQEYLGGENKHCPGNKRECKEEYISLDVNVFRSAILNRKLSKLKVRCPNESCQCIEELSRMEDHLRICIKQKVNCPYIVLGCVKGGRPKDEISTHLSEDTLNHSHLLLEFIQNMNNEVCTLKEESQNNADMKKDVEKLKEDLEVTKSKISSLEGELVAKENIIEELKMEVRHLKDDFEQSKREIILLKESKAEEIKIKEIEKEIELLKRDSTERETRMNERMRTMETDLGTEKKWGRIKDEVETSEREGGRYRQEAETKWETMKEEVEKRWKKMEENVTERINKLKETLEILDDWRVDVGETFLRVDRFSVRKTQNERIMSPYFYSHTKGYKLRLQVYPGGDQGGKGTHLSVYLVMCKGEYDDLLPWPCMHSIKISLIDQSNQKEHYSETFSHSTTQNENKKYFDKPIDKDNGGLGYNKFFSLGDLRTIVGLSLNDVIVLKCTVTAPL